MTSASRPGPDGSGLNAAGLDGPGPDGAGPHITGLRAFNVLPDAGATRELSGCCASTAWAVELARGRPYPDPESLYAAAEVAVRALDADGLAQALTGHPRIGERATGPGHLASAREQAGVAGADPGVLAAIAAGNIEYERVFGHVYLVCATGRSAAELLEMLQERLGHDAQTEERVTRGELAAINRIRLGRMLAALAR